MKANWNGWGIAIAGMMVLSIAGQADTLTCNSHWPDTSHRLVVEHLTTAPHAVFFENDHAQEAISFNCGKAHLGGMFQCVGPHTRLSSSWVTIDVTSHGELGYAYVVTRTVSREEADQAVVMGAKDESYLLECSSDLVKPATPVSATESGNLLCETPTLDGGSRLHVSGIHGAPKVSLVSWTSWVPGGNAETSIAEYQCPAVSDSDVQRMRCHRTAAAQATAPETISLNYVETSGEGYGFKIDPSSKYEEVELFHCKPSAK